MNAADFLDAILPEYRAEIGPIVGFDFIDRFIVQNRARLLRSLEPLMELLAEERAAPAASAPEACQACGTELEPMGAHGVGCPRCADREIDNGWGNACTIPGHDGGEDCETCANETRPRDGDEDPDAVTPEKDAIVWAAFTKLVNQKRREIGMDEIEATESLPFLKKFFGRREPDRAEIIYFIKELKETRKSDWRLAELLSMHLEFPEAKVVEWLNEYNICPGATARTMASKCDPSRYAAPPKKKEGWLSRKLSGRPTREQIVKVIRDIKRERRDDWMLAPSLGGHFGVPDETIVEWLRFHELCPRATTRSMASQCVIEDVESLPRGESLPGAETRYVDPEIFASWKDRLTAEAEGLDLADPEDRVIFRTRVAQATSNVVNSLVGALARQAGYRGPLASSRFAAERALADTWILRSGEMMESLPSCGCGPTRSEMAESLPKPGRSRRSATDRKMDDLAAKYGMTREEWLADSDKWWNSSPDTKPIAITMRHNRRRDLVALVTASASEPGRFQVTWVDNEGPSGHTTRDTPEEAVRYAVEEGYRLDDATTNARDRDLVERVQRAREARAAEIDSWVTESLPRKDLLHPKELMSALHHFAPFKRGDYVIRLGDMLGMEGELGGYVMAINRNEGTAKIEQDNGEIKPWPLDSLLHDTKENRAKAQAFDDQIAADASVRVDQAVLEWKAR